MISAGVETINFMQKMPGKGGSIPLFLLFKTKVPDVRVLKDRAGFSLCTDVSLAYTV